MLQQRPREGGAWEPLAYFSKKLRPPELKYSAFDRELLAVYLGIRHFRHYLEGRNFPIFTDHRPLTFAMAKSSEPWSHRQARHLEYISQYSTDIRYVAGADNTVADALSRAAIEEIRIGVDFSRMAVLQKQDPETTAYRTAITDLKWEEIDIDDGQSKLLCDTSTGVPRPLVPAGMRRKVFELVHGLSHPGTRATVRIITSKFVWHGIAKDVRAWARGCMGSRQRRSTGIAELRCTSSRGRPLDFPTFTSIWWDRCHHREATHICLRWSIDSRDGQKRFLSRETDTVSIGRAFALHWVARFGVLEDITSDRGPQFTSDIWRALTELLGAKIHHTTAYHPQANGLVERFHRSLKAALRAHLMTTAWLDDLPWVMLGLRTTPKEDMGVSVADMVYGMPLTVPGAFVVPCNNPDAADHLRRMRDIAGRLVPAPDSWHGTRTATTARGLREAEYVFVPWDASHGPLQTPYTGPYHVLQRQDKYFIIQCGEREESVSVDRLKPANAEHRLPHRASDTPKKGTATETTGWEASGRTWSGRDRAGDWAGTTTTNLRPSHKTGKNSASTREIHSNDQQ